MNTNLEYYKFFYYVGKLHSITLAAEELNVSQPAVSQAIRNLERELGTTLFMRTSRGVRLTAEGQTLYGYVQRGFVPPQPDRGVAEIHRTALVVGQPAANSLKCRS